MKILQNNKEILTLINLPLRKTPPSIEAVKKIMHGHYVESANPENGQLVLSSKTNDNNIRVLSAQDNVGTVLLYPLSELLGPPDMDRMYKISIPFLVPENGYIFMMNSSVAAFDNYTVKGVFILHQLCYNFTGTMWLPVNKGDTIRYSYSWGYHGTDNKYFVPCSVQKG